jgi:hypothetical protein
MDQAPGEMAGYGPIPADLARELAADGTWRRLLTDPASGVLLDYGRTTYKPPAGLADFVRARDMTCRFPGCTRPSEKCELDHRTEYPKGRTCACNLDTLCVHHHQLKHRSTWRGDRLANGDYRWVSPAGKTYIRHAEPIADPAPSNKPPAGRSSMSHRHHSDGQCGRLWPADSTGVPGTAAVRERERTLGARRTSGPG